MNVASLHGQQDDVADSGACGRHHGGGGDGGRSVRSNWLQVGLCTLL